MAKIFEKIVVEYPHEDLCTYPEYKGKPYFSIQYEEYCEHFIGFGTYKPEVFSQYLSEYFVNPSTQKMKAEIIDDLIKEIKDAEKTFDDKGAHHVSAGFYYARKELEKMKGAE